MKSPREIYYENLVRIDNQLNAAKGNPYRDSKGRFASGGSGSKGKKLKDESPKKLTQKEIDAFFEGLGKRKYPDSQSVAEKIVTKKIKLAKPEIKLLTSTLGNSGVLDDAAKKRVKKFIDGKAGLSDSDAYALVEHFVTMAGGSQGSGKDQDYTPALKKAIKKTDKILGDYY